MYRVNEHFFFVRVADETRQTLSYLWRICWAVDRRGTTVDRRDWRSRVVWGTRSLILLWKPCPAGRWWPPVVVAFLRARRTRNSLYPAATSPRLGSSPCAIPRCCNANTRNGYSGENSASLRIVVDTIMNRNLHIQRTVPKEKKRYQTIPSINV